jgi:hypothetical protein
VAIATAPTATLSAMRAPSNQPVPGSDHVFAHSALIARLTHPSG